MIRVSGSFAWGIRWETIERRSGHPVFGAVLPYRYESRRQATRNARRLSQTHPVRCSPISRTEDQRVRYIVCARRHDEPLGL